MIAGTHSGAGKTTITCAILQALRNRNLDISSFKCGCDYIDPMFHQKIMGVRTCHLDAFFCEKEMLCHLLKTHAGRYNLIEGVMGFYDGLNTSSCAVAELTDTPVILVLDCKGMSHSLGAVMQGFLHYQKSNHIKGFIFNRLPEKLTSLAQQLCDELHTEYFGFFPTMKNSFQSRHLGLVTADEINHLQEQLIQLGEQAEKTIQIDKLLTLDAPVPAFQLPEIQPISGKSPVIAVSKDEAFCFLYPENIELLEKSGCQILYFSPLHDAHLPDADGLILCGGYPELYADDLAKNQSMKSEIVQKIRAGMPVIAECGGFLYLHQILEDKQNQRFAMANLFQETAFPTPRLQRFGYITMTAKKNNLLCRMGETLRAHEFHYWDSTNPGADFSAVKTDGRSWECVHADETSYLGFPHLYFYGNLRAADNFVRACQNYQKGNRNA